MNIDFAAFLTFALVTSITPGPNNITALSFSMSYGYKGTLSYILGIITGVYIILLICAFLSGTLFHFLPELQKYMKYVGGLYILWLAYKTLRSTYDKEANHKEATFQSGLLLQLVNPKGLVFGMTLFTTFLAPLTERILLLPFIAMGIICITFCCVSTWALFGNFIKKYMQNKLVRKILNAAMALALVYTALKIAEFL